MAANQQLKPKTQALLLIKENQRNRNWQGRSDKQELMSLLSQILIGAYRSLKHQFQEHTSWKNTELRRR
jgi:hypothetical protein